MKLTKLQARKVQMHLRAVNEQHGRHLEPQRGTKPTWRSRDFLVVRHEEDRPGVLCRLTVNRTMVDNAGEWLDGISWDTLQRLKREAGFADHDAVEVYPSDDDVVNVSNMRHLWILAEPLAFKWANPSRVMSVIERESSTSSTT